MIRRIRDLGIQVLVILARPLPRKYKRRILGLVRFPWVILRRIWPNIYFVAMVPWLFIVAYYYRSKEKKIDVGLGPDPIINNVYHKRALNLMGYSAETFVVHSYLLTDDFDINLSKMKKKHHQTIIWMYTYLIKNYKCIYIHFNGGPLSYVGHTPAKYLYALIEPLLYKISRTKVVVMPYGGDIQDFRYSTNLMLKNRVYKDYPLWQRYKRIYTNFNVFRWTSFADYIISGCDWVYYLYHWDRLLLLHISIDTKQLKPSYPVARKSKDRVFKILHCPNHTNCKGSEHFFKAIEELKEEGYKIEFLFIQKMKNEELLKIMATVDIVLDQLIIGWYAMTAIEAMAFGKPVVCRLDQNLVDLYEEGGLVEQDELPLVNADFRNVKESIRELLDNPSKLNDIGKDSRRFVEKHHSLEYIGSVFKEINMELGVSPSKKRSEESK